jgi:hypothetical protein
MLKSLIAAIPPLPSFASPEPAQVVAFTTVLSLLLNLESIKYDDGFLPKRGEENRKIPGFYDGTTDWGKGQKNPEIF